MSTPAAEDLEFITDKEMISPMDVFKVFWYAEWTRERKVKDIEQMLKNSGVAVLIRYNNKPIAFARAITDFTYRVFLEDVIVVPKYQNSGIGKLLVEYMEKEIEKLGIGRIELTSAKTCFWEKCGYKAKQSTTNMIKYLK